MTKQMMVRGVLLSLVLLLPSSVSPQNRGRRGRIRVTVVGGSSSAPINGAEVLVSLANATNLFAESAPTNSQGVASISRVPFGLVVIQTTARGWRPSGSQHLLSGERMNISIRLEKEVADRSPSPSPSPSPQSNFASFVSPLRDIRSLVGSVRRPKLKRYRRHH